MEEVLEKPYLLGLKDIRLEKRFEKMLNRMFKSPTSSIPETFSSPYQAKAAYRFFDNSKVESSNILKWHKAMTYQRITNIKEESILFVIQDTSNINYSTHESKKDIGPIHSKIHHGIKLHPSIVITPTRIPLGIIKSKMWSREETTSTITRRQKSIARRKVPIEEKESYRWLESMQASQELARKFPEKRIINIADRESDISDYL